ncbi:hypothetical protein WJ0W_001351 [Paenibacillus melissococcoides]|uniref:Uncharacterized protein n=1 Tax=Paenibacillus melissococcoides TaxID=2912268 RepID=A0ABM9FY01_9BACL|nr:hypothetical protein WJ0W_001351 [Paenibacillus melissococcoides]
MSTRNRGKRMRIAACALAVFMVMGQAAAGAYTADAYVTGAYAADEYAADSGFAAIKTRAQRDPGSGTGARAASQHDLDVIYRDLGG